MPLSSNSTIFCHFCSRSQQRLYSNPKTLESSLDCSTNCATAISHFFSPVVSSSLIWAFKLRIITWLFYQLRSCRCSLIVQIFCYFLSRCQQRLYSNPQTWNHHSIVLSTALLLLAILLFFLLMSAAAGFEPTNLGSSLHSLPNCARAVVF